MNIEKQMKEMGIDQELAAKILGEVNAGESATEGSSGNQKKENTFGDGSFRIPGIDGQRIIDRRTPGEFSLSLREFDKKVRELELPESLQIQGIVSGDRVSFSEPLLEEIGLFLLPRTAFGILNGGSASTYADEKKNRDFNPALFDIYRPAFENLAPGCRGKAKGVTPAFTNSDGSPGPSFLELKMRALLLKIRAFQNRYGRKDSPLFPFFQMTSILNDESIAQAYREYRESPLLAPLIESTGVDITRVKTGVQPLSAALTHRSDGLPRRFFTSAWGKEGQLLSFPGGHGQNFSILKKIYLDLYSKGKRYAYLSNVDNLGAVPDPAGIAMLALSGKQAAFDFSFRTPVDIKGGILLEDPRGRLTCADIGAAVSRDWTEEQTARGEKLLFNCATGLFDLAWLVENIDTIAQKLPMRITEQDKDPGKYAQTEQITWEVMGMMDDVLIFGVDKYKRFLASKLMMENLMLSGIALDHPDFPRTGREETDLHNLSVNLNRGLESVLEKEYGMIKERGKWVPRGEEN